MADAAALFYEGQPGTGDTLLYTAPSVAIVRGVHIVNTSGSTRTVTLGFNAGATLAAANHFLTALSLLAGSSYDWSGFLVLSNGGTVRALQENATACTFTISGITT